MKDDGSAAGAAPLPVKPCPFCGTPMGYEQRNKQVPRMIVHPKNDCILRGYGWAEFMQLERWNRRAAEDAS